MTTNPRFFLSQQNRTAPVRTGARRPGSPGGFSLIELMISIALVVILILGVSQVFQYTTQAVGSGEAITAAIRNSRSVQSTFNSDFGAMVGYGGGSNDAPCLIISSRAQYAYRDLKDQNSQLPLYSAQPITFPPSIANLEAMHPEAAQDLNGDGIAGDPTVNGEIIRPDVYNYRHHRLDTLSFFARNQFARQTGNPGTFVANEPSAEAWIWYGHLWLPNNSGAYPFNGALAATFPCATNSGTNPNNYFGSKLVLGRQAILMQHGDATGYVYDRSGTQQWCSTAGLAPMSPLSSGASVSQIPADTSDASVYAFQDSRVDVANNSISDFYTTVKNNYVTTPNWYDYMMDGNYAIPAPLGSRFKCNPFVAKPMSSASMAQASPYLLGGCSQFIVEFAGDFVTQDNDPTHVLRGATTQYGDITALAGDGQLDFFINSKGVKQTIWYGMPRNTSGKTTTSWANGDVVPLRDWLLKAAYVNTGGVVTQTNLGQASFERFPPPYPLDDNWDDYMTDGLASSGYTCAFQGVGNTAANPADPHPKIMLIRITLTLEDPTGRLPEGQTFQYVFPVTPASTSN